MSPSPPRRWWPAMVLLAFGLALLYAGPLRTGFLNDDYLFLEEARTRTPWESLTRLDVLGNYYRPLSRQLYFGLLTPLSGGHPLVFHLANLAILLAALGLLFRLLTSLAGPAPALAATALYAVLPLQRVNLTWISCSQDLLALLFALAALDFHRRDRRGWAAGATLLALASKESALPLAGALVAWDLAIGHRGWRAAVRRCAPALAVTAAWAATLLAIRLAHPESGRFLRFTVGGFVAAYAHALQGMIGLEDPAAAVRSLAARGPALGALAAFALLAPWFGLGGRSPGRGAAAPRAASPPAAVADLPAAGAVAAFGLWWIALFAFVTGPVAHGWSAYYYTLTAVGGAALATLALRRLDRWRWLAVATLALWWHAGIGGIRAFAVTDSPWTWTSHQTSYYFDRAAALTDSLSRQLRRSEPSPAPGTRFFFATLPPYAGFQMGNGALIRALYRDPSLESHFYSRAGDSTAGAHPVRFLYWDGAALAPLYAGPPGAALFQVGTDLLLLDRPAGAAWALRRSLAEGGEPADDLYWLGWAELWNGRRDEAEAAWRSWGAVEDSAAWFLQLRLANTEFASGRDTVRMRRLLLESIRLGVGRPQGHATLAALLETSAPKYAALEYKVAAWLDPQDAFAQRGLALALARARLDPQARAAFRELERRDPGWREDPRVREAWTALERRDRPAPPTVDFGPVTGRGWRWTG